MIPKFVSMVPIEKGWSGDRKYKAVDEQGKTYLLRISPLEKQAMRERLYSIMKRLPEDLSISHALDLEVRADGVYTTFTWVNGQDAEEVIPTLSSEMQYQLGYSAGIFLRQIHHIPAPADLEPWEVRFGRKIDRKIEQYRKCPLSYPDGDRILAFVEENRHLIQERPQCFQHGDYHIGNMMIEEGKVIVIDFDRCDYGDPWEEWNRIVWCAQVAPAFAAGQLDGYFDGRPPEAFFRLLALYIAVNTLSSLPWAMPFGQEQIDVFLAQEREIMAWYDSFDRVLPKWYEEVSR